MINRVTPIHGWMLDNLAIKLDARPPHPSIIDSIPKYCETNFNPPSDVIRLIPMDYIASAEGCYEN